MPRAMPVGLSVYGGLVLGLALNPTPNPKPYTDSPIRIPQASPVASASYCYYHICRLTAKAGYLWSQRNWGSRSRNRTWPRQEPVPRAGYTSFTI